MVQSISLTNGAKHITYDWCKAYHLRMVQSISLKNGAEHITYEWCRAYHLRRSGAGIRAMSFLLWEYFVSGILIQTLEDKEVI